MNFPMRHGRFLVWILPLLLLATAALAGDVAPYAYGYLSFPDDDVDEYRFRWLRTGAYMTPETDLPGELLVRAELDLSRDSFDGALRYGYAQWTTRHGGAGDLSLVAGRFRGPANYVWPSSRSTRVICKTAAQKAVGGCASGVQVRWMGAADVRVAHANDDDGGTRLSGWADWKGVQAFFVQDVGGGAALVRELAWWLNLNTGAVRLRDGDADLFWFEYALEHRGVRLTGMVETTDGEDEEFTVSVDVPYAPDSSLRAGYATREEAFRAGVTFSY
jgi:hypothetical protein